MFSAILHSSKLTVSLRLRRHISRKNLESTSRSWCLSAGAPQTPGQCLVEPSRVVQLAGQGRTFSFNCFARCGQHGSPMQPAFTHQGTSNPFMLKHEIKHVWVDSRVLVVDTQLHSGSGKALSDHDIQRFCGDGHLDKALGALVQLENQGTVASMTSYGCLLKECSRKKALGQAKKVHRHLAKHGLESSRFLGEYLVSTMVRCGSLEDALQIFHRLSRRTVFSWTALISGYTMSGQPQEALRMYRWMQHEGMEPNTYTLVTLVKACGTMANLEEGKSMHAEAIRYRCETNSFVGTCLIDMYAKCGSIVDARFVFNGLSERNVVSWTVMLSAYVEQGQGEEALHLYDRMREEGVTPDVRTLVAALRACGVLAETEGAAIDGQVTKVTSLQRGKALHADARKMGYDSNVFIGNTLISVYAKCGSIQEAYDVFAGLNQRDVVSWNAMLTVYSQHGRGEEAWQLYRKMQEEGVTANDVTLLCILQACSTTASLYICRHIHRTLHSSGKLPNACLASALIHAYGRCGTMVDAQTVFDGEPQPGVQLWTALIAGYARLGNSRASVRCFDKMQLVGVKPDGVTFLAVLSACSHAGLVEEGVEYFCSMSRDHGITPEIQHYASVVDILGRAGDFRQVQHLLSIMPMQPDLAIWSSLLGACRKHGNVLLGKQAFGHAVRLQPKDGSSYVLMSDIYADAGLWDQLEAVKKLRDKEIAWKKPGKSWIQQEQEVTTFVAEDLTYRQYKHLYHWMQVVCLRLNEKSGSDFI